MRTSYQLKNLFIAIFLWLCGGLILYSIIDSWISNNYWMIISLVPIILFLLLSSRDESTTIFSIGSFVMIYFILFFLVRGFQLTYFPQSKLLISLHEFELNSTLSWISLAMSGFVISYHSAKSWLINKSSLLHTKISWHKDRLLFLSVITTILAMLGLTILLVYYGGIIGLFERFATHAKSFQPILVDNFGIMFWTTFYTWSVWLWALSYSISWKNKPVIRGIFFFILAVYSAISIFLFGSRTYLIAIYLGVAAIIHWRVVKLPKWFLIIMTPLGLAFSYWIISYRTMKSLTLELDAILDNLGHSVLDVILAIVKDPLPISLLNTTDRWLQIPIALVPRIIWPGKPNIIFTRIDWLVSFYYNGQGRTINAGNPASIFGEWLLYGDWLLTIIVLIIFGILCGLADKWIFLNRRNPLAFLIYLPVMTSLVTYYKDGDFVLFFISLTKSLLIGSGIFLISARFLRKKARNNDRYICG